MNDSIQTIAPATTPGNTAARTTGATPNTTTATAASTPTAVGAGGEVIVRMYRGAMRFVEEARAGLAADPTTTPQQLATAYSVVDGLRRSLDHGVAPDLCASLDRLYEYMLHQLETCAEDRDATRLDAVAGVLATLLDAWEKVSDAAAEQQRLRRAS
jgi:flagellar biosynthetic protein FliS